MSKSVHLLRGGVAAALFVLSFQALAEEAPPAAEASAEAAAPAAEAVPAGPRPPWLEPEVIKASVQIGLTEAQQPEFRRIVGQYITDRLSMIQQEIRRSPPNLDRVIKSKSNRLEKAMDEQMKVVLTDEQWKPYENYKKALKSKFRAGV
jgi:hypothetical protein